MAAKRTPHSKRRAPIRRSKPAPAPAAKEAQLDSVAPFDLNEAEIERCLVTGEQADLLKRYFGQERYEEMRDLARRATSRSVRGGPRVLLLPGIMGSTLGSPRSMWLNDVIWVDPIDIAAGYLISLAMIPGPTRHQALGVLLVAYLKLKLSLRLAGYDADFHAYDWRLDVSDVAKGLVQRIAKDPAEKISLVAHSMGGLVSRAALAQGAKKVDRLIMLGTPNHGSFAPVQVLRSIYPIVRKLTRLDMKHSAEELTEKVFSTFPGVYQLLPDPKVFSTVDLFDPQSWPAVGPQPRAEMLKAARNSQDLYAPPDERFCLIAGINQETIVGLEKGEKEFVYTASDAGDGTVPLSFAQLPNVTTYFVEEAHGSLPNNGKVAKAVKDLLGTGKTDALPQQWTPKRGPVTRSLTEDQIRAMVPAGKRGAATSDQEVRSLLEEVVAPEAREEVLPVAPVKGFGHLFDRVVVGRRRQRRLDLRLALGSITEVNSHAYVVGIFRDVTPTGAAKAIDERLDGAIAEFSRRRMFSGNSGEVFVLPTGYHPLRPSTILLAGLGSFDQFSDEILQLVAENVMRTFIRTGVEDFATVLMGGGSGADMGGILRNLLVGFLRGLKDSDSDQNFRRVTLCEMDSEVYSRIKEELYRLASTDVFADCEVTFEELKLPPAPEFAARARGLRSVEEAPVYLMVRQESSTKEEAEYVASILTAGAKATVVTNRQVVSAAQLRQQLAKIGPSGIDYSELDDFGASLAKLLLGDNIPRVLETLKGRNLVIVHDAIASKIPWETLRFSSWQPALEGGLSRRYLAENLSIAKWLEERRRDSVLNVLLVVNPTEDLSGALEEGKRLRDLFAAHPGINITERRESQATKPVLEEDFGSGKYDVIHYAGHAFFDPEHPSRSGILCSGRMVLSGADLAGLSKLPTLIFFNACEAGRLRGGPAAAAKPLTINERIDRNVGLAEAFLRGGAANYVGTYWPVGDTGASAFAEKFYNAVLNGSSLGAALLAGRTELDRLKLADWADYILYGSPDFVLKEKSS